MAMFDLTRASPVARRLARELGVDLSQVKGTGPQGRIQGSDVQRYAEGAERSSGTARTVLETPRLGSVAVGLASAEPSFSPGLPGRLVPLSRKRRVTAERMALSARNVARVTLNADVDAGELIELRRKDPDHREERAGPGPSYDAVLTKVVARALIDNPYLNARWVDDGIYLVTPINVGVAVAVDDGLVVVVIRNADRKGLADISMELSQLLGRAHEDKLTLNDLTEGTFTITNLGMFGVDSFTPIVNPPESAILGVGRIVERPVVRDGQVVPRPMMTLSLSFDHRVVDGAPAARFLRRVCQLLENPSFLS